MIFWLLMMEMLVLDYDLIVDLLRLFFWLWLKKLKVELRVVMLRGGWYFCGL